MRDPDSIFGAVMSRCIQLIDKVGEVHFGHILKVIEQTKGCQIFIEPFKEHDPKRRSCLVTCDPRIVHETNKDPHEAEAVPFRQHYIFYKKAYDINKERFTVAHELGHCDFHWPLGPSREQRLRSTYIPDLGNEMYLVQFDEVEQQQANIFASILLAFENTPGSSTDIIEESDSALIIKAKQYMKDYSL